jgi:hypothetical protein
MIYAKLKARFCRLLFAVFVTFLLLVLAERARGQDTQQETSSAVVKDNSSPSQDPKRCCDGDAANNPHLSRKHYALSAFNRRVAWLPSLKTERVHVTYVPPCGSVASGTIIPEVTGSSLGCE